MYDSFIGRQAIYDRELRVHAYELLYRAGPTTNRADFIDGDKATATVVSTAFLELGARRLAGDAYCFVNLTSRYILGRSSLPMPPNRVVIEVLEDIKPTPEIVRGVDRLKRQGAKIALDDYTHRPGNEPLLELADYVKIDIQLQDHAATEGLFKFLRRYRAKLLAEKVETEKEMKFCQGLGFDYFQGCFLTKPEIIQTTGLPANRVVLLRTLQRLFDPTVDFEDLVRLISQDATLAYKLLRYCNSTRYAPNETIASLPQMVVMLGLKTVRNIVSLLVLADLGDKPGDLVEQTLVRARMCELIGLACSTKDPASFYTVGLLSTLDALTGTTMEAVLEHLPMSKEIEDALIHGTGEFGRALACVRAFERGDWDRSVYPNLGPESLSEMYAGAVHYCRDTWVGVSAGADAA